MSDHCPACKQLGLYRVPDYYLCDNKNCRVSLFRG